MGEDLGQSLDAFCIPYLDRCMRYDDLPHKLLPRRMGTPQGPARFRNLIDINISGEPWLPVGRLRTARLQYNAIVLSRRLSWKHQENQRPMG